jgi:hypothetical protein
VASFRLLGDKVHSFFAPLIPKMTGARLAIDDEDLKPLWDWIGDLAL